MVHTYAGEMVDIAWFCETDDRMDENVCLASTGSTDGQFSVSSVHRITSLEGDDSGPTQFLKMDSQFGWGVTQGDVIVMLQTMDGGDLPADVIFLGTVVQIFDGWVFGVAAKYFFGFFFSTRKIRRATVWFLVSLNQLLRFVHVVDGNNGEVTFISKISKGCSGSRLELCFLDLLLGDVETYWHTEETTICES